MTRTKIYIQRLRYNKYFILFNVLFRISYKHNETKLTIANEDRQTYEIVLSIHIAKRNRRTFMKLFKQYSSCTNNNNIKPSKNNDKNKKKRKIERKEKKNHKVHKNEVYSDLIHLFRVINAKSFQIN